MFEKLRYFLRFLINRFTEQKCSTHVTLINNLPEGKKKYISGSISLCHCKGHGCILLEFYFDGFCETDRRLFGEYHYFFDDWLWVIYFGRL